MSDSNEWRKLATFPVHLSDNLKVAMMMGIAGLGALFLSVYYDYVVDAEQENRNHGGYRGRTSAFHNGLWT